jgi:AraC-like DNA-binding protein
MDTRGIVRAGAGFEHFELRRREPSPGLAWAVDRYWIVRWDLTGQAPYEQKIVPHPANHLVFEGGRAEIEAISRDEFVRKLEGRGHVLGIKFRPAGFRPFLGRAVSTITDQRLPSSALPVLGSDGPHAAELARLAARIDAAGDAGVDAVVALADDVDDFLSGLGVEPLSMTRPLNALVDLLTRDRSVVRVDDLARRLETSTRRLQRLFAEHIGLGPKWVINRCRILEAAELAAGSSPPDWAALAAELGYSDQAHLVRDFTAAVGTPPDRYAKEVL